QIVPDGVPRRKRSDHAIEPVEQRKIRRGLVETFELSAALFAHRKTQSMPESSGIITFPSNLRNACSACPPWRANPFGVRSFALPKCSTSAAMSQLRKNWMQLPALLAAPKLFTKAGATVEWVTLLAAENSHAKVCFFARSLSSIG